MKTAAWKMFAVKKKGKKKEKGDSQNLQLNRFSRDWHSYPWYKGNSPALASDQGRGTKAAKKSLKC